MVYILNRNTAFTYIDVVGIKGMPPEWFSFHLKGLPIPAELIPRHWAVTSDGIMPHLFMWQSCWFVSQKAKALLKSLVPSSIEFIPVTFTGPDWMELEAQYYFINVLVQDRLIDYKNSQKLEDRVLSRDGTYLTRVPRPPSTKHVAF